MNLPIRINKSDDYPITYHDPEFKAELAELVELWYEIITTNGACVNENAQAIFYNPSHTERAIKDYCRHCSVRQECLSYAVAVDESGPVWGGFDADYRQGIKTYVAAQLRKKYNVDFLALFWTNAILWNTLMKKYEELATNPEIIITSRGTLVSKKKKDKNYLVI